MQYSLLPTEKEHTKVNWSFHQKSGNFPPIMTESDYPETLGTNFPTKQFLKNAQTWARAFSTLRLAPGIQLLGGHWANPPKFYIYCCVHPRCANAPLDKCIAGQKNIRNPHFPEKIWISALKPSLSLLKWLERMSNFWSLYIWPLKPDQTYSMHLLQSWQAHISCRDSDYF